MQSFIELYVYAKPQSCSLFLNDVLESCSWLASPSILWLKAAYRGLLLPNKFHRLENNSFHKKSVFMIHQILSSLCKLLSQQSALSLFCLEKHLSKRHSSSIVPAVLNMCPWHPKLVLHVCFKHSVLRVSLKLVWIVCQHLNTGPFFTVVVPYSISINPLSIHLNRGLTILLLCSGWSFSSQFILYWFLWQ